MNGSVVRFAVPSAVQVTGASLTTAEEERAAALRDLDDRTAYVAAHLLARQVTAELLGIEPVSVVLTQTCVDCGGPHGRPSVQGDPDVWVTLSHTRGAVAAIAATGPCGVDVEQIGPRPVPTAAFTPDEIVSIAEAADPVLLGTRLWVAKEAAVKAGLTTLDGLADSPAPVLDGVLLGGGSAHSKAAAGRWSHDGLLGAWLVVSR